MKITIITPKEEPRFETILARYNFSENEKRDMGLQLSRSVQESSILEDQKKQVMSDFKAKLDRVSAESNELATKISNGYEMRNTRCRVELHPEDNHTKHYLNANTGDMVKKEDFSQQDYQQKLPLNPGKFEWITEGELAGSCKNSAKYRITFQTEPPTVAEFELAEKNGKWLIGWAGSADMERDPEDVIDNSHMAYPDVKTAICEAMSRLKNWMVSQPGTELREMAWLIEPEQFTLDTTPIPGLQTEIEMSYFCIVRVKDKKEGIELQIEIGSESDGTYFVQVNRGKSATTKTFGDAKDAAINICSELLATTKKIEQAKDQINDWYAKIQDSIPF